MYPKMFGRVVAWIYNQVLASTTKKYTCDMIYLWLIADDLAVPKLQNQLLVGLEERRAAGPIDLHQKQLLDDFYRITPAASPIRRYIADTWDEKIQMGDAIDLPQALLIDIINSKSRRAIPGAAIRPQDYFVDEEEVARTFASLPKPVHAETTGFQEKQKEEPTSPLAKIKNEPGNNAYDANEGPRRKKQKGNSNSRRGLST